MPGKAKTVLIWFVVAFLVYAIVRSPDKAADVIKGVGDVVVQAFQGIGDFFSALVGK